MANYNIAMKNLVDRIASRTEGNWQTGTISSTYVHSAIGLTRSLRMPITKGAPEDTSMSSNKFRMIQGHTYYARIYEFHDNGDVNGSSWELYWGKIV